MNAYYENRTYSNKLSSTSSIAGANVGDKLISLICALVAFFTRASVVRVTKAAFCTALFFAFFGIIGAMDNGSIGMFFGVALCAVITLFEYLALRSTFAKRSAR